MTDDPTFSILVHHSHATAGWTEAGRTVLLSSLVGSQRALAEQMDRGDVLTLESADGDRLRMEHQGVTTVGPKHLCDRCRAELRRRGIPETMWRWGCHAGGHARDLEPLQAEEE